MDSGNGKQIRNRERSLTISEIMTILILFHQSHYRNFKAYYLEHVLAHLNNEFPGLVSYSRFVDYIPSTLVPSVSEGMKWSGKIEKQPSGEYFAVITGMDVSPVYIKLPSDTFSDNGPISNFDYR